MATVQRITPFLWFEDHPSPDGYGVASKKVKLRCSE